MIGGAIGDERVVRFQFRRTRDAMESFAPAPDQLHP
jgi:hypothetical protein